MKQNRLIALLLCALLVAGLFTGCGFLFLFSSIYKTSVKRINSFHSLYVSIHTHSILYYHIVSYFSIIKS